MLVRDILKDKPSAEIHTISPYSDAVGLLDALARHDVGALVVSTDGIHLDGIVSERDVVRKLRGLANPRAATVRSIMTTHVHQCTPDTPVADLMRLMTERRVRHVPVLVDGRIVGIVSIGDVVKHRMTELEFERDQLSTYVQGG